MPRATGTGKSTPRERGAYGNNRGKERQRRRAERRRQDPRVQRALAEARAQQRQIDALAAAGIESGSGRPALRYERPESQMGPVEVVAVPVVGPPRPRTPERIMVDWSLADAIRLLDAGYSVAYVARRTKYDEDVIEALV